MLRIEVRWLFFGNNNNNNNNRYLSPLVAKQFGVAASQWLGAAVCLLCVLCTIPLVILDMQAERKIKAAAAAAAAASSDHRMGE